MSQIDHENTPLKNPSAEEAIAERSRGFEAAFAARDADDLVEGYFVEDEFGPVASPPGNTGLVRGRAALKSLFTSMFESARSVRLETESVTAGVDVAYELGRAHLALADGSLALGRYAICWISTPTGWRVKTDFFAADSF